MVVFFFHSREGVLGALGLLLAPWGPAPMAPATLRFASSISFSAMGTAPFSVPRAIAVEALEAPALPFSLLAVRELGNLVIHTLVKTVAINFHELVFNGWETPPLAGEMRPSCTLSSPTLKFLSCLSKVAKREPKTSPID